MEAPADSPAAGNDVNEYLSSLNSEVFGLNVVRYANLEAEAIVSGQEIAGTGITLPPRSLKGATVTLLDSVKLIEHDLPEVDGHITDEFEEFDEPHAEVAGPVVHTQDLQLNVIRKRLSVYGDDRSIMLTRYCERNVSGLFRGLKKRTEKEIGEPTSWQQWLTNHATDDQLTNFLQWHTDKLKSEQDDPEVQAAIKEQREQYKENVLKGIEQGWLPIDAVWAARNVDMVTVYLGDVFDTLMKECGAYAWKGYVVLAAPSASNGVNQVTRLAHHEFNHTQWQFGARWLNEALTEHVAESLVHGEPERVNPLFRTQDSGIYVEERAFLAALLDEGDGDVIPARFATLAYAEPPEKTKHKKVLEQKLMKKWGRYLDADDRNDDVLIIATAHVSRLESELLKAASKGGTVKLAPKTVRKARQMAVVEARWDLLNRPRRVFGKTPAARAA